jgi:adenylate kinase
MRADDTAEALADRLADYHSKTEPVLELFRRKELVFDIDGTAAPEAIQAEIRSQLTGGAKKCHG